MSSFETKQAELKEAVIAFLNTCKKNKCQQNNFWNKVSRFMNRELSRKNYGVSKMNNLLDKFSDVLEYNGRFVSLRQPSHRHQDEVVVVDSDSDEECSISRIVPGITESGKENMGTYQNMSDCQFLDRAASVLFPLNGQCRYWQFIEKYQAKFGPLNDIESKLKNASDFIKLVGDILYLTPKGLEYRNASARGESSQQFGQNVAQAGSLAASIRPSWGSGVVLPGKLFYW